MPRALLSLRPGQAARAVFLRIFRNRRPSAGQSSNNPGFRAKAETEKGEQRMSKYQIYPKTEFTNVRHLVEWASEKYGSQNAYSFYTDPHKPELTQVTFAEFAEDVRALSSELLSLGCAGKHCCLIGKLSYEWALVYFSVLSIGGVLVPLDRDWQKEELADTAKQADVSFVFGEEETADKLAYLGEKLELSLPPVLLTAQGGEKSLADLLAAGREKFAKNPDAYYSAPINPMKLSLLVFTSGTTGKGKGVMLSQNAILADMYNAIPYVELGKKTVGVLPPHHTYGSTILMIGHVMIGSEVFISSGLRYLLKELHDQKPVHLVLVPLYLETFYRKIVTKLKEQGRYELVFRMITASNALRKVGVDQRRRLFGAIRKVFGGELRVVITGGAPISPEVLHFFDGIGITMLNGYGITECSPLIAVNRSRHVVLGSVGDPIDSVTVKIDEPNEDGEGEILVKGPVVMLGYYKNESATADAFKEGSFRTGDYGKLDKSGVLYITGRKKNLIILSNGKNVYPEEIENELSAAPGVSEIIVYEGQSKRGISHNAIVAEIYPDTEYFEQNKIEDIQDFLKQRVDEYNKKTVPYKKISIVKVRNTEFPKNTLRKIQRFKLNTTID